MLLTNYVSAMDCWKGRVDSTTDYDAFRWHQWVQPLDLNEQAKKLIANWDLHLLDFAVNRA